MPTFSIAPGAMITSFWSHRRLILNLVRREVVGRYRGSNLGLLWSFFNPVFMLAVYTFVFSVVFKARWGTGDGSKAEFALILFSGLLVFNLFAECVNRAPTLILSNVNFVKKVIFPLEILPWVVYGAALFHASISLLVWLIFSFFVFGIPPLTFLLLPFALFPLTLFIVGLSWVLASLGVYLRDISQLVGILTTMLMFLTPIFYPSSAIPEKYQFMIYCNPLAFIIEIIRGLMISGTFPEWSVLGGLTLVSMIFSWAGFIWFQKTRKGFADVL